MWGKSEEISSHFPHYFLTFSTLFPHKNFLTLALEIGRIPHMANVRKIVRKVNVRKIVRKMRSSKMWGKMWGNFNTFSLTLFPHMDAGNWPLSSHGNVRKMWGKLWGKFHYYFSTWIPHIESGKNPHICEGKCEENFPFSTFLHNFNTLMLHYNQL